MAEREDFIVGDDCLAIFEGIEQDLLEQDVEFSFHITKEVAEVSKTLKATFIDILNCEHSVEPQIPGSDHWHGAGPSTRPINL